MTPTSSIGAWPLDARVAWRYQLNVPPVAMHAAPDDTYLLVADVFGTVRSLDTASGEVRWERNFGMQNVHDVRATLGGATVLLEEGRLLRLDDAGQDAWEAQVGALRSGFDTTADGALIAMSAAVHEVVDDQVRIGAEISLWDGQGGAVATLRLPHAVSRLRFTSERGDLVCCSPEGRVSFLKDRQVVREAQLGSTLDGLVSCLDGSLILMSAGSDGIHVLSAAMQSLGVLEVGGPVEDVDVSEDGSAILVKERDGLIYLMDGHFRLKWRGRMERPVLRVDLAGDGSFAYAAESTGEILRFDFEAQDVSLPEVAIPEDVAVVTPSQTYELGGTPVRAGLGRMTFLGTAGELAVQPRPSSLVLCRPGQDEPTPATLQFSAAHATADPHQPRLALWSSGRLALADAAGALQSLEAIALTSLIFCANGDLAQGTAAGLVRRLLPDGAERFSARVGAAVLAVAEAAQGEDLLVLCADGSLSRVNGQGEVVATQEFSRSVVAQPDLVGDDADGIEGADAPQADADFWDKFGRTFQLRSTASGPVLFHGMGRILWLGDDLKVRAEAHLGNELADVQPLGDGLLAIEAAGTASVLDADLQRQAKLTLGSRQACAARSADGPVILDATEDQLWIRGTDGAVKARAELYPEPRALAVSPDGRTGAVLLDTKLLVFDLS